jgi:hypothetical protein
MVARIDHITVIAPSLEVGAAYVEAALGVPPAAGRSHPSMATHNLLLALGNTVYLEIISTDPNAAAVTRPRWFGLDGVLPGAAPRLAAWVASTDDIIGSALPELGEVETMRRENHVWQMTVRSDGSVPLDGAAPLLIQRASTANPTAALPQHGLQLKQLLVRHPDPTRILTLLAKIGLDLQAPITVARGDACSLVAEIQTPLGLRWLGEA